MKPTPVTALVNTFEFEREAHDRIPLELFDAIKDQTWPADGRPFDRLTLRPRMMVDTRRLDLTREIFGVLHFAPIIANSSAIAAARPDRFHPDGDKAMAKAAVDARAVAIVNGFRGAADASQAWIRVSTVAEGKRAADGGAKVLIASPLVAGAVVHAVHVPVVAEDVMSAQEAVRALGVGASGLIVSRRQAIGLHPIDVLGAVVDKVGKVPVIIGGDFRRGTDILKALAMGAAAVRVTRPVVWALASYGTEGVTVLLEMLQTELARNMAMCGKINLAALSREDIRIHSRRMGSKG